MTPEVAAHLLATASEQTITAVDALMLWVSEARTVLSRGDKMDGMARARNGELLIAACRYLAEREAMAKKNFARIQRESGNQ